MQTKKYVSHQWSSVEDEIGFQCLKGETRRRRRRQFVIDLLECIFIGILCAIG